jgi:hypothetical protein
MLCNMHEAEEGVGGGGAQRVDECELQYSAGIQQASISGFMALPSQCCSRGAHSRLAREGRERRRGGGTDLTTGGKVRMLLPQEREAGMMKVHQNTQNAPAKVVCITLTTPP